MTAPPVRHQARGRFQRAGVARLAALAALAAAVAVVGLGATASGRAWLHGLDRTWFGERMMDTLARVRSQEDWSRAEPLRRGQDYRWLARRGDAPVRIAHALGEAGTASANTLAAMQRSYRAGFRLFEVDLVEEGGELRCEHDPGLPSDVGASGCTFEGLMTELPADAFVVLDIKTDFAATGQRVLAALRHGTDARRVVFQLYRPEHLALFDQWQRQYALPGPIVTGYLSHRRVDYLAREMGRLGVAALTLPLERVDALGVRPVGLSVLLHPIHDASTCARWRQSRTQGAYLLNTVACSP